MYITKKQNGFSLLEALLVVVILSITVLGISAMFNEWLAQSIDNKVGREMVKIQNISEDYIQLNFDDTLSTIPNNGDIIEIDIQDLKDNDALDDSYIAQNSYQQEIRIFARNLSVAGGDNIIEVISVGESPNGDDARMKNGRLFRAATSGSSKLGVISALDTGANCCEDNIQNIHGLWQVSLADFNAFYNSDADIDNGGYIAAYGRIVNNPISYNDDYLYRVETGNVGSNRMNTNLDLNGNSIIGEGVLTADNIIIAGDTEIQGNTSNVLDLPYKFAVLDNFAVGQNMLIRASGNTLKGRLTIDGNTNGTSDFIVTDTLTIENGEGANGGLISATNLAVSGDSDVAQSATFNAMAFGNGSTLQAGRYFTSRVRTQNIKANSVLTNEVNNVTTMTSAGEVLTTRLNTGDLNVRGNVNARSGVNMNGNTNTISGTANAQNTLRINHMSRCGGGCTGYEGP